LPIYGNGKNIRDWLYVEDHARGIDLILKQDKLGEVYNIGGHNEWTNIDIVKLTFETGIVKTVDWYLDNPGWWKPLLKS